MLWFLKAYAEATIEFIRGENTWCRKTHLVLTQKLTIRVLSTLIKQSQLLHYLLLLLPSFLLHLVPKACEITQHPP